MTTRCAEPVAFALLMAAAVFFSPEVAMAQNEVAMGALRAHQWLVIAIRGCATLLFAAGFIMWAAGRWQWQGGIIMVCGIIGAIFSDRIATEIIL